MIGREEIHVSAKLPPTQYMERPFDPGYHQRYITSRPGSSEVGDTVSRCGLKLEICHWELGMNRRCGEQPVWPLLADMARIRSVHPDIKLPAGMKALSEIKIMKPDAAAQELATTEIKKKYAEYFGL